LKSLSRSGYMLQVPGDSAYRVSVIIPTYNRVPYLGDAIRSVLAQSAEGVEIIVVDDGSTDGTEELVRAFHAGVIFLRVPHRGQPAATRNRGLEAARGDFIALLDSDDLFLPGKLTAQCAALAAHPDVAFVYSNGYFFRDDPDAPISRVLDGLPTPSGDGFADLLRGNFLVPAVTLVRRSCLDAVGAFDEALTLRGVEDYDLWLRLAARFPILYVPGDVAAIRRHADNLSRNPATIRMGALQVLEKTRTTAPDLVQRHFAEWHEGAARCHGAILRQRLRERRIGAACPHAVHALIHAVRTPGGGLPALLAWYRRRAVRHGAQP
jgi:glycosyltransferase involved in cell wall biosynthesis